MVHALEGRTIAVTGSSSGIGAAVAIASAHAGANVLVHGHQNVVGAERVANEVRALNRSAEAVIADISTDAGRAFLAESAARWSPTIDAWVHCAGVDVLTGQRRNLSFAEKLDLLWAVDVRGTMLLARHVAQSLSPTSECPDPSMIFLGWDQAIEGMEGEAGQMFGPIKAAVTSFALNLAQSLSPTIRVNCVAPGWIKTAWGEQTDPYWDQRARSSSLLDRWGIPEDIAGAVTFLLSPQARFINGQVIAVNGGWNRRFALQR